TGLPNGGRLRKSARSRTGQFRESRYRRRRDPMKKVRVRTGQPSVSLSRKEFEARFRSRYYDPAFAAKEDELRALLDVAWEAYREYRKSPRTKRAGTGFEDPDFELPIEWLETRRRLRSAEKRQKDPRSPSRVLIICGASRSDQT